MIVATGSFSIIDVSDGISATLSQEAFVATTEADGSGGSFAGASASMSVFLGTVEDTSNWTFSAAASAGLTGTLSSNTYTVTTMSVDAGFVDVSASRQGFPTITRRFTVSKSKKGNRGTITTARAIAASAWSDSEAATAISAVSGGSPVDGDLVTLYNSTSSYSETRRRLSGVWVAQTAFFGGDVFVGGSVNADRLAVGNGGNLLHNADFSQGTRHWVLNEVGTGIAAETVGNLRAAGMQWAGVNFPVLQMEQVGISTDGHTEFYGAMVTTSTGTTDLKHVPVIPGEWLYASAYLSTHRCTGSLHIWFVDSAGALISSPNVAIPENAGNNINPDLWVRYSLKAQAPANAAFARFVIRKLPTLSGTNSYLMIHKPQLERTHANATAPSSWRPGPQATFIEGGRIITRSVTASQIQTATLTANELAANSVTAAQMLIADLNNVIANPSFASSGSAPVASSAGWAGSIAAVLASAAGVPSGAPARTVGAQTGRDVQFDKWLDVKPGDNWRLSADCATLTSTGQWGMGFEVFDAAGVRIGWFLTYRNPSATWIEHTYMFTMPAGAARARPFFQIGLTSGFGTWYFTNVRYRRANAGELTVDGTVRASHLDSTSLAVAGLAVFGGTLKSDNYLAGESGWRVTATGSAEFEDLIVRKKNIAAEAVTASKVLFQDSTNIVPDADFEDSAAWSTLTGTSQIVPAPAGWDSANILQVDAAALSLGVVFSKVFRVRPGDTLFAEGQLAVTGGSGRAVYQIQTSSSRDMSAVTTTILVQTTNSTPTYVTGLFIVPAGARFARIRVLKDADSSTQATFGRLLLRNQQTTDLLAENAASAIREASINNAAVFTPAMGWSTIGTYIFTPSGVFPISLWMSGLASIVLPTAGVSGRVDVRILWRGTAIISYIGALSGLGAQTLTSSVSLNDRFTSGGNTSGTLELQVRATGGDVQLTQVRILLGEFKK